jgi:hypothetical protein
VGILPSNSQSSAQLGSYKEEGTSSPAPNPSNLNVPICHHSRKEDSIEWSHIKLYSTEVVEITMLITWLHLLKHRIKIQLPSELSIEESFQKLSKFLY